MPKGQNHHRCLQAVSFSFLINVCQKATGEKHRCSLGRSPKQPKQALLAVPLEPLRAKPLALGMRAGGVPCAFLQHTLETIQTPGFQLQSFCASLDVVAKYGAGKANSQGIITKLLIACYLEYLPRTMNKPVTADHDQFPNGVRQGRQGRRVERFITSASSIILVSFLHDASCLICFEYTTALC